MLHPDQLEFDTLRLTHAVDASRVLDVCQAPGDIRKVRLMFDISGRILVNSF